MKIDLTLNIFYKPPEMLENYINNNTSLYIPINCGNLKGTSDWCDKHLRYETDFKENIAHLNKKLNEMTAIYAYWKNLMKNPDYVGFQHYRRFFNQADFLDIEQYDFIDTQPIPMMFNMSYFTGSPIPNFVPTDIKNGYAICHKIEDWNKMEELLKKTPYYEYFEEWSKQSQLTSPCNLFIMKKKMFEEYCEFIFPILFELEKMIDTSTYDGYQKRQLAFLSERLTSLFLFSKKNQGYKSKTIGTMYFEDWKPQNSTDRRGQYL